MYFLKKKQVILLLFLAVVLFCISLISSFKISALNSFIGMESKPVQLSELNGDLAQGSLAIGLVNPDYQPLGILRWQQSYLDWLQLHPQLNGQFRGRSSELPFSAEWSLLSGDLALSLSEGALQFEDIMPLLALNRDIGRWLNGLSGRLEEISLQTRWVDAGQWLQKTQGSMRLNGFSFLGESLPPVFITVSQQQEQILIKLSAEEKWTMNGEIVLTPLKQEKGLQSIQYQGTIKVSAPSAESLPNWASLMKSSSDSSAQSRFQGNWALN